VDTRFWYLKIVVCVCVCVCVCVTCNVFSQSIRMDKLVQHRITGLQVMMSNPSVDMSPLVKHIRQNRFISIISSHWFPGEVWYLAYWYGMDHKVEGSYIEVTDFLSHCLAWPDGIYQIIKLEQRNGEKINRTVVKMVKIQYGK